MTEVLSAYGHSWIDSAGDPNPQARVAERTATAVGMRIHNCGKGGSISTETAQLLRSQPPLRSAVFLLMTGLNDLRYFGDSAEAMRNYQSALTVIFTAFVTANPQARVVAIAQPHLTDYSLYAPANKGSSSLVDEYNRILIRSGEAWPQVRVAVPCAWDPKRMLSPDTVHPGPRGHAYLSAVVLQALRTAFTARVTSALGTRKEESARSLVTLPKLCQNEVTYRGALVDERQESSQ